MNEDERIAELEAALRDYEIAGGEYDATRRRVTDLEAENERLRSLLNRAKPYIEAYEEATGESIEQILSAIDAAMEGE